MIEERMIKCEKQFPAILESSHNIQKSYPQPRQTKRGSGYLKKEEIKSEQVQSLAAQKKKSLQLRTSKCSQQDLKKGGQFGKNQPEKILSHTGHTLNEAKFLISWKHLGSTKPSDSYHPYALIIQHNPEILLNYFEENDQYIIIE
ncbi:unnamed protein product [Paramecium octaurelia]|uniref:Chromo domain-containing protein n=1 Tax=Paramecium octaurelia TaxID=43137 RepID=A0A8S1XX72_PAROT|nr:unnamed protein product [Paramecium octaurelia]